MDIQNIETIRMLEDVILEYFTSEEERSEAVQQLSELIHVEPSILRALLSRAYNKGWNDRTFPFEMVSV